MQEKEKKRKKKKKVALKKKKKETRGQRAEIKQAFNFMKIETNKQNVKKWIPIN